MRLFRFFPVILLVLAVASSAKAENPVIFIDGQGLVDDNFVIYSWTVGNFEDHSSVRVSGSNAIVHNYGSVISAAILYGDFVNRGGVDIADVSSGGYFNNYGEVGTITSSLNSVGSSLVNHEGGSIGVADGFFANYGRIAHAIHNDSSSSNYGWIINANISNGSLDNYGGTVDFATLNDSAIRNYSNGTFGEVTLYGNSNFKNGYGWNVAAAFAESVTVNDNGEFTNSGRVDTANLNGGSSFNHGSVGKVVLANGVFTNDNTDGDGDVFIADINGGDFNNYGGFVGTVNISGGRFMNSYNPSNSEAGVVSTVNISDNGIFDNSNRVTNANVDGGTFSNDYGGTANFVTVNSGTFDNGGSGRVGMADINSGQFYNDGTVNIVTLNDGRFVNNHNNYSGGTVNSASLFGGSYEGSGYTGNLYVGEGGTLDTGLYTGLIGNLTFAPGGLLLIDGASVADFKQVNIEGKVDLTGAIIQFGFDMAMSSLAAAPLAFGALAFGAESPTFASATASTSATDFSFDLASLFNFIGDDAGFATENWWEEIARIEVAQGAGFVELYNLGNGWFGLQEAGGNETPEPATMLILALGLAGLGLARRRR